MTECGFVHQGRCNIVCVPDEPRPSLREITAAIARARPFSQKDRELLHEAVRLLSPGNKGAK